MAQRTSTTVTIHGKETVSDASKRASGGLNRLESQTKSFSQKSQQNLGQLVTKFGLYAAAVAGAVAAVNNLVNAYARQEAAERKLTKAVENNPLLDGGSARRIKEFASELQEVSVVSDDVALSMATMLTTAGRTEEQIRDIITVAADYSAATGKDMETAVEQLNATFTGTAGEIEDFANEVGELTEEQLRAGDAVDILAEKVEGQAEALRDTTQGSLQAFANSWTELKENLGGALATVFNPIVSGLNSLIDGFNNAADAVRDFNEARREAREVEAGTADDATLERHLERQLKDARENQQDAERRIAQATTDLVEDLTGMGIDRGTEQFAAQMEQELGPLRAQLESATRLENQIARQLASLTGGDSAGGDGSGEDGPDLSPLDKKALEIQAQLRDTLDIISEKAKIPQTDIDEAEAKRDAVVGALNELFEIGVEADWPAIQNILDTYAEYLKEEEDAIEEARAGSGLQPGVAGLERSRFASRGGRASMGSATGGGGGSSELMNALGGFGGVMSSAGEAVDGFGGELISLTGQMGPLGMAVAAVNQLLEGFMQIMGPLYSSVLQPIGDMLGQLGTQLANFVLPVLEQLAPVLQLTAHIVGSVLNPILSALAPLFEVIYQIWGATILPIMKAFAVALEVVMSPLRFVGDLLQWFGDNIGVLMRNLKERVQTFGHNLVEIITSPRRAIDVLVSWLEALGRNIKEVIDFITSWGADPIQKHSGDSFRSVSPRMRDPRLEQFIEWQGSDAFKGLPDRIQEILAIEAPNFLGGDFTDGGGVHGGNTTVQRAPDIYVTQNFNGPVVGEGGMAQVGEFTVQGIEAYIGMGGNVEFLEAT